MLGKCGARCVVRWKTNSPLFISHVGQHTHTHTRWDSSGERRRELPDSTQHSLQTDRQTSMPPAVL